MGDRIRFTRRALLKKGLDAINRAGLGRKSSLPALTYARIAPEVGGCVSVTVTDLFRTIEVRIEGTADAPIVVPFKWLKTRAADRDEGGALEITADGERADADGFYVRLAVPVEDFPEVDPKDLTEAATVQLPAGFGAVLRDVAPTISTDDTRPQLTGVGLDTERNAAFSTDGHRLTVRPLAFDVTGTVDRVLLLGRDPSVVFNGGFEGSAGTLSVHHLGTGAADKLRSLPLHLSLHAEARDRLGDLSIRYTCRQDETPPPWHKVVPQNGGNGAHVDRAALLKHLKRAAKVAPSRSGGIRLQREGAALLIRADNVDTDEGYEAAMDASFSGDWPVCGISARYLVDALNVLEDDTVSLWIGGELDPMVVREAGAFSPSAAIVIMPLRI
jgi:DNA polymerase III sliding clamp (beta) subunit (PCNA family)